MQFKIVNTKDEKIAHWLGTFLYGKGGTILPENFKEKERVLVPMNKLEPIGVSRDKLK